LRTGTRADMYLHLHLHMHDHAYACMFVRAVPSSIVCERLCSRNVCARLCACLRMHACTCACASVAGMCLCVNM
jgi:hypothetical protein